MTGNQLVPPGPGGADEQSMEVITGPVGLENLHGDVLSTGEWSAGGRRFLGLSTGAGPVSVLHHLRPDTDYLVHRGTLADFSSLVSAVPGRGGAQLLSLELVLGGAVSDGPRVDVAVLEFDDEGAKSRVVFHEPGGLRIHALREDCRHFLVALRLKGEGAVPVRHFRVETHDVPVLPGGHRWMTHTAVAPVPDYVRRLLVEAAGRIPESDGSRHHSPRPYAVALLADPSVTDFYRDAFRHVDPLGLRDYGRLLRDRDHDLLLCVEGGPEGNPARGVPGADGDDAALEEILGHFRRRGRPTVLQCTTDADGLTVDHRIAGRFDHVFTSNPENVPEYRRVLGHERVHHLPAGANPLLHHPVGSFRQPPGGVLMEGAYPAQDDVGRGDLEVLLDSVIGSGVELLIADPHADDPAARFPARFRSHSTGPFDPSVGRRLRKVFRHHVTVHSSKLSREQWYGQLAQLQAQGLSILSNFARSVFNAHPQVRIVPVGENLADLAAPPTLSEVAARLDGVRDVMTDRTVFDLVDAILAAVGLEPGRDPDRVLVLADDVERARPGVEAQGYPHTVLRSRDDFRAGEELDAFCAREGIAYLAPWSASVDYGPDYLQGRVNVFKFVDRDYATQLVEAADWDLASGPVHEYTDRCGRRDHTVFSLRDRPASMWWSVPDGAAIASGYATDPLQVGFPVGARFAPARPSVRTGGPVPASPAAGPGPGPAVLTVVMPVYNNGRFLLHTSLPSLRRQALWPQLHVLLVDDGSSDAETLETCASLAANCPNISFYTFGDGGSGSASRPRNKGVELATTELVTFLDPDNEISPGGYDRLVAIHGAQRRAGRPVQFVGGYQVKVAEDARPMGRYARGTRVVEDVRGEFFGVQRFPLVSSQAAVMERSLFREDGLSFVEGAAGEDTLFGWEVILTARGVCFTDEAFLVYYAGRDGSVSNDLGASFFRKYLILERARVQRLARHGVLDEYRAKHFGHFMQGWYLPRLDRVRPEDQAECRAILAEITGLYGLG